jgi:hypothetical protein
MPIPDWRSCFWHSGLSLFLTVYVDDFKMSGPSANMAEGWRLIRQHVRTEAPQAVGKYLGCDHRPYEFDLADLAPEFLELLTLPPHGAAPSPGLVRGGPEADAAPGASKGGAQKAKRRVNALQWDMSDFLKQCVGLYQELGGDKKPRS